MAYFSEEELSQIPFQKLGKNVKISNKASIYNPQKICIGDNVRIDDFVVISAGEGGIHIGSYIHIGVYSSLIGAGHINLHDFVNISSRVSIYSNNDDYSGEGMTNPMIPDVFKKVLVDTVILQKHVIVGSNSVVLPGVTVSEGCAIGAFSLVKKSLLTPFTIYAGVPAKAIGSRSSNLLELADAFMQTQSRP